MSDHHEVTGLEIAVIGMAARFPGASNVREFWQNIESCRTSVRFFTADELRSAGVREDVFTSPQFVPARGILRDTDKFDASFFGISPREAALIDPQHRLFLETAWQSLEAAGYDPRRFPGHIGVFGSVGFNAYVGLLMQELPTLLMEHGLQAITANEKDFLTTRVSYKLGLTGPSMVVQTGCSSSLVAIHQGCQSLIAGESDMVLAGGVSLDVPEVGGHVFQEGMIYSRDGHCRPFDKDASGTVSGSGVGIVVLKRLDDAIRDGDFIHAVLKGGAVNNDGATKVGYAAPSALGQSQVICSAHRAAGVHPSSIGYVETHGTATKMGDPIEIEALRLAFAAENSRQGHCALGSAKAQIGHLDAAAGVAGFIRAALAVERGIVPAMPGFNEANPLCRLEGSPFHVPKLAHPWPELGSKRRAGVSSFGVGGTNAHLVLEEPPPRRRSDAGRPWQLLCVSAASETALSRIRHNLADDLLQHKDVPLADIAYSLHLGRRRFDHAGFVVANNAADAAKALEHARGLGVPKRTGGSERLLTFMFPGQGAQFSGMARALYAHEPSFAADMDYCSELLSRQVGTSIADLLFGPDDDGAAAQCLRQTRYLQPALFVIEYALARLFMRWGIKPAALIGHSVGEYVAATIAGVFSVDDALRVVALRGRLMQSTVPGSMLLVNCAPQALADVLGHGVDVAAVNSPQCTVVAGADADVATTVRVLTERGIAFKRLEVSHAFHSKTMEPILAAFGDLLSTVRLHPPAIPVISNVTGDWLSAEQATDRNYWCQHLRRTVQFAQGLGCAARSHALALVEVGPGTGLARFAEQTLGREAGHLVVSALPKPESTGEQDALFHVLEILGKLWAGGIEPDWSAFYESQTRNRVPLSTYPFCGESYWVETLTGARVASDTSSLGLAHARREHPVTPGTEAIDSPPSRHAGACARPELRTPYVAPVTSLQGTVCRLWAELFGIDRVGVHDVFSDLGGDSIMALGLASRLERELGLRISVSHSLGSATPAEQASTIETLADGRPGRTRKSAPVALRKEGGKPPFFCVHPAGGIAHCYSALAESLPTDQPFYAFEHPGIDDADRTGNELDSLARAYVDEMLAISPLGPYYLGGWSFGGSVAFAMACELSDRGCEVGMLALFDTPVPSALRSEGHASLAGVAPAIVFAAEVLGRTYGLDPHALLAGLVPMPKEEQLDLLMERAIRSSGMSAIRHARDCFERMMMVYDEMCRAEAAFTPRYFPGRMYLYEAAETRAQRGTDEKGARSQAHRGWHALCRELSVRVIPGDHFSIMSRPHLAGLSEALAADIAMEHAQEESIA